jgi:hypothetical protein
VFVGESAHFRLYVDRALLPLPADLARDDALAALETNWSDFSTMLHMPDGQIAYYVYTSANIPDACGTLQGGCTKEDELEVDAPTLPNAHELTHAYLYLRARRRPVPFLAEGIAEAIGCAEEPTRAQTDVGWRAAVASLPTENVYGVAGQFVRYLIRAHGIDAVLRYYEQSPERRDPALFGANFESFWGLRLDDVWAAAWDAAPAVDTKICPCSLPPLASGPDQVNDPARTPYWTIPADLDDTMTIALIGRERIGAGLYACDGTGRLGAHALLTSPGLYGPGWYVRAGLETAAIDRFVSESCAGAARYQLPPVPAHDSWLLDIILPAVADAPAIYLALDTPSAHTLRGPQAICDSCDFDPVRCPVLPVNDFVPVSGPFYARVQVTPNPAELNAGFVRRTLWFAP